MKTICLSHICQLSNINLNNVNKIGVKIERKFVFVKQIL